MKSNVDIKYDFHSNLIILFLRTLNRLLTLSLTACVVAVTFIIPKSVGKLRSLIKIQNLVFRTEIDRTPKLYVSGCYCAMNCLRTSHGRYVL
jgi:hypothetical protein